MEELSLSILDIVMNSLRAGAKHVKIEVFRSEEEDIIGFEVSDDGCGMSAEALRNAADPFFTSRTERRVGLGLSLLKSEAEAAGGGISIESEEGRGTRVRAWFRLSSLDTPPLGDMESTIRLLKLGSPDVEFIYATNNF